MTWEDVSFDQVPPLSGQDSFVKDGKIYYLGWDDQLQFLVFDEKALGGSCAGNAAPWVPEGPVQKEKTKLPTSDLQLKNSNRDRVKSGYKQVSKKAVMERIEKLEYFSNSLTLTVTELISRM